MVKPIASLKAKNNYSVANSTKYETVFTVIHEADTWLSIAQISFLSKISPAKCGAILARLIAENHITSTAKSSSCLYGNLNMAKRQSDLQRSAPGIEIAKSKFELWPELMDGKTHHVYVAKPNMLPSLAMLFRRA